MDHTTRTTDVHAGASPVDNLETDAIEHVTDLYRCIATIGRVLYDHGNVEDVLELQRLALALHLDVEELSAHARHEATRAAGPSLARVA